jgi:hypothetical protein
MSKRALLVGINTFARPEWQLRGCVNDTLAVQQMLKSFFDFPDADACITGEFRGLFTWALCQAITDSHGDITYDELIARAGAALSDYEQRPQLECSAAMRGLKLFTSLT